MKGEKLAKDGLGKESPMFSGVKEERGSSSPWRVILSLSTLGLTNLDAKKNTGLPLKLFYILNRLCFRGNQVISQSQIISVCACERKYERKRESVFELHLKPLKSMIARIETVSAVRGLR